MATNQQTPDTGGGGGTTWNDPNYDYSKPWWQNPPPAGWTGPWPPPLGPGDTYGPVQGQVNYTPEHAAEHSGVTGNTPPPTTNPNPGPPGPDNFPPYNNPWTPP